MATLEIPEYVIELWTNDGVYVADVSEIITSTLRINFKLNDVETVDFTIDLKQFEDKCARIGANPVNILNPYTSEVRIRRNGSYIVGAQVVQLQANFNNKSANTVEVRCTGYLNYFKDRYITGSYLNMTYAEIARQLITDTQLQANGDFGVGLGVDTASAFQQDDRERNYDMQNIKDAIINLTKLENDNFDFVFRADKTFDIYQRLGSDKPNVELNYPQNIYTMSVLRDASTLANKIVALGSGIGDERLESTLIDTDSAVTYRVRERIELFNSIERQETLDENAAGLLNTYKDIYEVPSVNVTAYDLDINNVAVGDSILVTVEGSTLISNINSLYRIVEMDITIDKNISEDISLKLVAG